jgi:hypothetical protein
MSPSFQMLNASEFQLVDPNTSSVLNQLDKLQVNCNHKCSSSLDIDSNSNSNSNNNNIACLNVSDNQKMRKTVPPMVLTNNNSRSATMDEPTTPSCILSQPSCFNLTKSASTSELLKPHLLSATSDNCDEWLLDSSYESIGLGTGETIENVSSSSVNGLAFLYPQQL